MKRMFYALVLASVTTLVYAQELPIEEPPQPEEEVVQPSPEDTGVDESPEEAPLEIEDFLSFNRTVGENNDDLKLVEQTYKEKELKTKVAVGKQSVRKELVETKREQLGLRSEKFLVKDETLQGKKERIELQLQDETLKANKREQLEKRLLDIADRQNKVNDRIAKIDERISVVDNRISKLEAQLEIYDTGVLPSEEADSDGIPLPETNDVNDSSTDSDMGMYTN